MTVIHGVGVAYVYGVYGMYGRRVVRRVLCVVCVVCLFPSLVVSLTTTCITSSTFRIVNKSDNSECKVKYVLTIGVGG